MNSRIIWLPLVMAVFVAVICSSANSVTGVASSNAATRALTAPLDDREKIEVEILRGIRDTAQERLSLFDNIAITVTVALLPSLLAAMWWARAKERGVVATRIFQTLPFLVAFFISFILHTRSMTFVHARTMKNAEVKIAERLGLDTWDKLEPKAEDGRYLVMLLRVSYYSLGIGTLIGVFIWSAAEAYKRERDSHDKHPNEIAKAVLALHCLLVVLLAFEGAAVIKLWLQTS
jgi:steroid 5-alpha reductase family enzyme